MMRGKGLHVRLGFGIALLAFAVPVQADNWNKHVPTGWKLIGNVSEGQNAVLIVEEDNPAKRIKNEGLGSTIINTNPRKLLFLRQSNGSYQITGSADRFLPSEGNIDSPCDVDPLNKGGMSLKKGVLTISLRYWASCGSYGTAKTSYKFRVEANRYRLIGLESLIFSRATAEGEETSINFLTSRKSVTADVPVYRVDDYDKPVKRKTVWSRVGKQKYYLDSMDMSSCDGRDCGPGWCLTS